MEMVKIYETEYFPCNDWCMRHLGNYKDSFFKDYTNEQRKNIDTYFIYDKNIKFDELKLIIFDGIDAYYEVDKNQYFIQYIEEGKLIIKTLENGIMLIENQLLCHQDWFYKIELWKEDK